MPSQPRISVNKLGEYMTTTSAVRRRAIIRQQISPHAAVVPRYRQATEPIRAFLASGGIDVQSMANEMERLRKAPATSDWTQSDNQNTADGPCNLFCVRVAGNVICWSVSAGGPRRGWRSGSAPISSGGSAWSTFATPREWPCTRSSGPTPRWDRSCGSA